MQITSIFSFSHNVFYPIKEKNDFSYSYILLYLYGLLLNSSNKNKIFLSEKVSATATGCFWILYFGAAIKHKIDFWLARSSELVQCFRDPGKKTGKNFVYLSLVCLTGISCLRKCQSWFYDFMRSTYQSRMSEMVIVTKSLALVRENENEKIEKSL